MIMQNQISEYVEPLQELLRLLGNKIPDENGKGIDEVGFKQDDHQFFVLREVE